MPLTEKLVIKMETQPYDSEEKAVQLILHSLPARFNDGKISLKVSMRNIFFDFDKFMYWIEAFKKELIFD